MNKKELINKITELSFACLDMNLYLDTHPEDTEALNMFNSLSSQLIQNKNAYEKKFGPLTNFGLSSNKNSFQWVDEPWPWEKEFNN